MTDNTLALIVDSLQNRQEHLEAEQAVDHARLDKLVEQMNKFCADVRAQLEAMGAAYAPKENNG